MSDFEFISKPPPGFRPLEGGREHDKFNALRKLENIRALLRQGWDVRVLVASLIADCRKRGTDARNVGLTEKEEELGDGIILQQPAA